MYAVAVRVVAPGQMVPTVLLIPFNADLHISLAVRRFLSVFFCILQLDLSGRSGIAIEVRRLAWAPASSESSLAQCVLLPGLQPAQNLAWPSVCCVCV